MSGTGLSARNTTCPRVSVIVLNWNGLEDTIECLESLKKTDYPNYEVLVVDNASPGDDAEALNAKYAGYIHVMANDRNYGFSEGNNIGIRYALDKQSDYVFLLNNDTVVDPGFLSALVVVAEGENRAGILGGKIYYYSSPNRLQSVGGKIHWRLGLFRDYGGQEDVGQYDRVAERDFVYATAMLIKREVIERIGFLDSSLFFGMEDYDYCARAAKAGFRVMYVPGAKVWHKQGASRSKLPDYPETWHLVNKEKGLLSYKPRPVFHLFRKHGPRHLWVLSAISYMVHTSMVNSFGMIRGVFYYLGRGDFRRIKRYSQDLLKRAKLRVK